MFTRLWYSLFLKKRDAVYIRWAHAEYGCLHTFRWMDCRYCMTSIFSDSVIYGNIFLKTEQNGRLRALNPAKVVVHVIPTGSL